MKWLSLLVLLAFLVAGCAGSNDDTAKDDTPDDPDDPGDQPRDDQPQDEPDGPIDNVTETVRGATLSSPTVNGTAPLPVTFTIEAQGTDANATWLLDFGDGMAANGTMFPDTAVHNYTMPGNYTALLTVTYADGETAEASHNVTVLPGAGGGAFLRTYEDAALFGIPAVPCGLDPAADLVCAGTLAYDGWQEGLNGTYFVAYEFSVFAGATMIKIDATAPVDAAGDATPDYDMYLYRPDGTWVADSGAGATDEHILVDAPEAGDYVVFMFFFAGADSPGTEATFTMTLEVA